VLIKGATGFHVREGPSVMARTTLTPAQLARNRLAGIVSKSADPEAADAARRDLKEIKLAEAIRKAVATWPPLTDRQRAKLALLLNPGAEDGQDADGAAR
jgi:hypothetical protein